MAIRSLIINIDVPDLQAGIAFYEAGLGFTLRRTLFEDHVAELTSPAGPLFLLEQAPGSRAVPGTTITRDYAGHWTPMHLDIAVDDLDAAVARAAVAGARSSGPIRTQAYGRLAPMRDPFGHGFCLIQFSDRGYDAVVFE